MSFEIGNSNADKIREKLGSPPLPNRGVDAPKNTPEKVVTRALVDWVSVRIRGLQKTDEIFSILGMEKTDFFELEIGKYGYRKGYRSGHIAVYYLGSKEMGIYLEMSGQGCRQYESQSPYKDSPLGTWAHLFSLLKQLDVNFTRLDLAVDDFSGLVTTKKVWKHLEKKAITSQFRKTRHMTEQTIKEFETTGDTIYFGSSQSDVQVRFYDKKLERENNDKDVTVEKWCRVEFQLRDAHANMAAVHILTRPVGEMIKGYLNTYIQFRSMKGDTRAYRRPFARWYLQFLQGVEKLSLSSEAKDYTIERVKSWVEKSVTPSLAMILAGDDYTNSEDLIRMILSTSVGRISKKQINAINLHRESLGLHKLTIDEVQRHLNNLID